MNSIGPGLGTVGAVQNFAGVPDTGMYLLSFGMLLGRLEIYTVLVLFSSHFWRRA
jgi:trk system potassium uptake protein TrkH